MIVAVIQARMSSARLPGKVIMPLNGKPLLHYAVEAVSHASRVGRVVVATSARDDDSPVAALCQRLGVACVRGPLDDVAARFLAVFDAHPASGYVRINGDSPVIDPSVIDLVVARFEKDRPDLATNVFPRSFPKGMSVEVLDPTAYRAAYPRFVEPADKEHVTRYHYYHPDEFRIANVESGSDAGAHDFTIDFPEQAVAMEALLRRMTKPSWSYGWRELVALRAEAGASAGS